MNVETKTTAITSQQELFCQGVAESGKLIDSYLAAGYSSGGNGKPYAAASKLLARQPVRQRVAEIRQYMTNSALLSKDLLAAKQYELYQAAKDSGQISTASAALREVGRLYGYYVEHIETSIEVSATDERLEAITTADLAAFVEQRRALASP